MSTPTDPPCCRDPFVDLLDLLVNGEATTRDMALINDTLRADPEARRTYIRVMAFEAMLAREFASPEESQPAAPARARRWPALTAIAATLLLAATLAWQTHPEFLSLPRTAEIAGDEDEPITHAVITSLEEASGRIGTVALSQGLRLTNGLLEIDRGLVEITFDSGAEVTLEGPARLQLESENKSRLDAGRASAQVPEQARGFVIHTPSSYIRDLGTAFAVEVREDLETDLHVLEGKVEVAATGPGDNQPPTILCQSEAVRLGRGTMQPIHFRADHPGEKRRPQSPKAPPSLHWSFDSWDGPITTDSNEGRPLKLQQKKGPPTPRLLDGPFGLALHFNGQGLFARAEESATADSQDRTVTCWVRLQPGDATDRGEPNGIIGWGAKRSPGNWQIAWNQAQGQGTLGALRVEFGDGFVIGSTDLRDGRWHHLAVVTLGGANTNVATHVRIYCDGRLEAPTGRHPRRIAAAPAGHAITLGRYSRPGPGRDTFFEGDLDELQIFDGALLPGQIMRLMKRNSLSPIKP